MSKEIVKEFSNGELTIVWKPKKCIHAGECVKALPKVYQPKENPWIKIENASTEDLKVQIRKCPSGALSYYMNDKENLEAESMEAKIEITENGPLVAYGSIKITDRFGNTETLNQTTAFCRCGKSNNKPYCDGSHIKVDFKG
jgi:uncharacterized Fe-S cluster protein YjdI